MLSILRPISYSDSELTQGPISNVIIASNGVFERTSTFIGNHCYKVAEPTEAYASFTDLPELKESFRWNKAIPRIPVHAYKMVVSFYKHINDKFGTEAQARFYWNEDNITELKGKPLSEIKCLEDLGDGLFLYIPTQINSAALTETKDPIYFELREKMRPILETHSHNSMPAFESGTDSAYTQADGAQMVIGRLDKSTYEIYSYIVTRLQRIDDVDPHFMTGLVELPYHFDIEDTLVEFPEEWLDQCKVRTYKPRKSKAGYYGKPAATKRPQIETTFDDAFGDDIDDIINSQGAHYTEDQFSDDLNDIVNSQWSPHVDDHAPKDFDDFNSFFRNL